MHALSREPLTYPYSLLSLQNNKDEDPIYLFDRHFYERAPNMLNEYSVPEYFQEVRSVHNTHTHYFQHNRT